MKLLIIVSLILCVSLMSLGKPRAKRSADVTIVPVDKVFPVM